MRGPTTGDLPLGPLTSGETGDIAPIASHKILDACSRLITLRRIRLIATQLRFVPPELATRRRSASLLFAFILAVSASPIHTAPSADASEKAERGEISEFRILRELPITNGTHAAGVAWSSDGTKLAAYNSWGNVVTVWGSAGQVLQELRRPGVPDSNAIAFIADDREVVTPNAHYNLENIAFSVFDVVSGQVVRDIPGPEPQGRRGSNAATVLAASPDESVLAVAFGGSTTWPMALYSTQSWQKIGVLPGGPRKFSDQARQETFSADGKLLAVATIREVFLYNVNSLRMLRRIEVTPFPDNGISWLSFSPDASMVAIGTSGSPWRVRFPDGQLRTVAPRDPVRVFRTRDGARVETYPQPIPAFMTGGGWSPDGRLIAFLTPDKLHVWNPSRPADTGRIIDLHPDAAFLAFSPDSERLAVTNGPAVTIFAIRQ